MNNTQFIDRNPGLFWNSKAMHKLAGEPCYLLEHKSDTKWVNANMDGWTEDAKNAYYFIDKESAEQFCKFIEFALELPWKVTEHIFD